MTETNWMSLVVEQKQVRHAGIMWQRARCEASPIGDTVRQSRPSFPPSENRGRN